MYVILNFCDHRSGKFIKSFYQEWEGLEQNEVDEKHSEEEVTYFAYFCNNEI